MFMSVFDNLKICILVDVDINKRSKVLEHFTFPHRLSKENLFSYVYVPFICYTEMGRFYFVKTDYNEFLNYAS